MTLTAVIRTLVQAAIAWALSISAVQEAVGWLAAQGFPIDWEQAAVWLTLATLAGVTALINWAGKRWPIVAKVASLGRASTSAVYTRTPAAAAEAEEPQRGDHERPPGS